MGNLEEHTETITLFAADEPGPTAGIVGGVHGNELAGIEAVLTLRTMLKKGDLTVQKGRLFLALGNPRAIAAGTRYSETDLNRCFTSAALSSTGGSYEHGRARELAHALEDVTLGIDIHGTNTPTEPFLVIQRAKRSDNDATTQFLSPEIILRDPYMIFAGEPATLDEYFARNGGFGICYETGAAGDRAVVNRVVAELVDVLTAGGWFRGTARPPSSLPKKEYLLRESIVLGKDGFRFTPGVGEKNFQVLRAGDLIGHHGTTPLHATADSVLLFPKSKNLQMPGHPVGYLAESTGVTHWER